MQEKVFLASAAIVYNSAARAIREYEERYERKAPGRTTVQYWKDKLWTEGSLHPRQKTGRPSGENLKNEVIHYVLEHNESTSQRRTAANFGTSQSTVHRSLRKENIRPWKYQLVHEITDEDFDRRLQFAEWILTQRNPHAFARKFVFSDECSFNLNGSVNRHNMVYYSRENQHLTVVRQLKSETVTVWAAVSYHHGITFVIMNQAMNSESDVEILATKVAPFILQDEIYQQDGAPPHFSRIARAWLDEHLHGRWIGRRGFQEWPPRSPDLTICDFWLWSFVKDNVYRSRPATVQEMRDSIEISLTNIPTEMIQACYREFVKRCEVCLQEEGRHIEHIV